MLTFTALVRSAHADPLVAVVVVDEEARERGFSLALEDVVVDDALPIDVAEGEHVQIVAPDGQRHALDVAPGEAWEVAGPRGEAWMARIGADVRSDVVRVRGDAAVVEALAQELGADLHTVGDDHWLVRDEVLFDVPWAETEGLERLRRVGFVGADEEVPERGAVARPLASAPPRSVSAAVSLVAPAVAALPAASSVVAPSVVDPFADPPVQAQPPVVAAPAVTALDPGPYVGLYLCGDDTVLNLAPGGAYSGGGRSGRWSVGAPGLVRLERGGAVVGRAAIEVDRHVCRAVW